MSEHITQLTGSSHAKPPDPDPSWRGLYLAGGISAILYILLALAVPAAMIAIPNYDLTLGGQALLELIARHRTWWVLLQSLVLETSMFLILTAAALFLALRQLNKSLAAIGALILVTSQILFMAYYPVLLGLASLSKQYSAAVGTQKQVFATAAEALIAQNNAFNPVYESLFAAGIFVFALVMLKGIFHRIVAWIGIASLAAVVIAMALFPVVGLAYFTWWILPSVWCVAVGLRLIRLGRASLPSRTAAARRA